MDLLKNIRQLDIQTETEEGQKKKRQVVLSNIKYVSGAGHAEKLDKVMPPELPLLKPRIKAPARLKKPISPFEASKTSIGCKPLGTELRKQQASLWNFICTCEGLGYTHKTIPFHCHHHHCQFIEPKMLGTMGGKGVAYTLSHPPKGISGKR